PAGRVGAPAFSAPPPGRACSGGASSRRGGSGLPPSAPAPRGRPSVRRSRPTGRCDRDSGRADGVTLSDADDAPVGACGARLRSPGGCEGTPEPPVGDVPAGGAGGTEGRGSGPCSPSTGHCDRGSGRTGGAPVSEAGDLPEGACGARLGSPGGCDDVPGPPPGGASGPGTGDVAAGDAGASLGCARGAASRAGGRWGD